MNLNLPNALTVLRILLIPPFALLLVSGRYGYALAVFAAAGLTDLLDGLAARKLGQTTDLGKVLDPLADKLLVLSTIVALTVMGRMPVWLTATVLVRDAVLIVGGVHMYRRGLRVHLLPTILGKATTAILIGVVLAELYGIYAGREVFLAGWLELVAAVMVVASGAQYVLRGMRVTRTVRGVAGA